MKKWNLIVDVALCENCNNCTLATKDEHIGNDFPGYAAAQPLHGHNWIDIKRRVRGSDSMVDVAYLPITCNHCDNAPCVAAAHDGAIYKRPDGIVIIDPEKAQGRPELCGSCPYGVIWWNEALQLPQKWIFDAHLLDQGWQKPRCEQACPTGALKSMQVEDDEMREMAKRDGLETLLPELNTHARVYYRNLYRYSKCFIGGSVTAEAGGVVDCVADARVTLRLGDKVLGEASSDVFGDFKFDGLDPSGGSYPSGGNYRIDVSHPQFGTALRVVELQEQSIYLGEIQLGSN